MTARRVSLGFAGLVAGCAAPEAPIAASPAVRIGAEPHFTLQWVAEPDQAGAQFGRAVAIADVDGDGFDDVLVGAPSFTNGQASEGRVSLYRGTSAGVEAVPAWTAESGVDYAHFGSSIAAVGDVDGDGYVDVAIGAPDWAVFPQYGVGRISIFRGSAAGLGAVPDWVFEGDASDCLLGASLSGGDVNGDGYADLVAGAPDDTVSVWQEGSAWLFLGSPAGPVPSAWIGHPDASYSSFGQSVSAAGDVDGDGYDDIAVGGRGWGQLGYFGRVWVYRGSSLGPEATASVVLAPIEQDAYFGPSLAHADLDGDALADLAVSSDSNTRGWPGGVYGYRGQAGGLDASPTWVLAHEVDGFLTGVVFPAGDVDGDGAADLLVAGVVSYSEAQIGLHLGSGAGVSPAPIWTADPDVADDAFGRSAAVGDVNGDGATDVLVGADADSNGDVEEGRAYVYLGRCDAALDADADGVGDACDRCPGSDDCLDADADEVPDGCDVCPAGSDWRKADDDGIPDACDVCPGYDDAADLDGDTVADGCDACWGSDDFADGDGDGVADGCDVCPLVADPEQLDDDLDWVGDPCDVCRNGNDQVDVDGDTTPDDCDDCPGFDDWADADGDGVSDGCDPCPNRYQRVQRDDDGDGVGDPCDACPGFDDRNNDDGDRFPDDCDNCLGHASGRGEDADGDGRGDACDQCPGFDDGSDHDGDGIPGGCDPCPEVGMDCAQADPPVPTPGPTAGPTGCGCGVARAPWWSGWIGLVAGLISRRRPRRFR